MQIAASSIPGVADHDAAMRLLTERAVLTSCVCSELDRAGDYSDRGARSALNFLRQWLVDVLGVANGEPEEGVDEMVVPDQARALHRAVS